MLSAVLAMYSTPAHPIFRGVSSGILTAEALKIAGVRASKVSKLGWQVILAQSGDRRACAKIVKDLTQAGFKANDMLATLLVLVPDNLCERCNGTGSVYSPTGHRRVKCDRCKGSGRRKLNLEQICEKYGANKSEVERAVSVCLMAQSDAEKEINRFLRKEKTAVV